MSEAEAPLDGPEGGCCAQGARVGAIGPGGFLDVSANVVRGGIRVPEGGIGVEAEESRVAGAAHGAAVDPG